MDFSLEYTKEQEEFAEEVQKWLEENVPKNLTTPREPRRVSREQAQKRRELGRKLGEKGWLYPGLPREYGGGGLDVDHSFVINHELDERNLDSPPYYDTGDLAAAAILNCGTEEQKKHLLPPILKGEVVTWQLFTEPEAGTDEANQQTNALRSERDGEYFIVNGSKIFAGAEYPPPDQFLLLTRSDLKAPRHQNLAMFIAPANLPGIDIQPLDLFPANSYPKVCVRAAAGICGNKSSVFFDDVRIHQSCLIGGERDGWRVADATLMLEHAGIRPITEDLLVRKFLEQCKSNPNVVRRLRENPQLLDSVVDIYIGAQIDRLFALRNAWLPVSGLRLPGRGPQRQLYAKMFGRTVSAGIARVLGPYAFTDDTVWGLDEGIFEVGERAAVCFAPGGTPEALKIVMSRLLNIGR